jgi:hypothetical protein
VSGIFSQPGPQAITLNLASVDGSLSVSVPLSVSVVPQANALQPVFRSYNSIVNDHFYSLTPNEAASSGWYTVGFNFATWENSFPGCEVGLIQCFYEGTSEHFLTNDPGCNGATYGRFLGYVCQAPDPGMAQLFLMTNSSGRPDHFSTPDPSEIASAESQLNYYIVGPLGWVPVPTNLPGFGIQH